MQNIITVSDSFKAKCKNPLNFNGHSYKIYNDTTRIDLTPYVKQGSFSTNSEEKSEKGLTSSDTFKFDIEFNKSKIYDDIYPANLEIQDMITDIRGYRDISTGDSRIMNIDTNDTTLITDYIKLSYLNSLVDEGDKIFLEDTFNGETIRVYTGYAKLAESYEKNLVKGYSVTVNDRMLNGIKTKFEADEILIDKFICKGADKDNSLAYILARKMGFADSDLIFDDAKDSQGNYFKVQYSYWKKADKVLAEFTQLAEAVNGKAYANNNDKFIFSNPYNDNDYNDINFQFDTNVLREVKKEPLMGQYDQINLVYDDFRIEKEQVIWKLSSSDSAKTLNDDANWAINANTTTDWYQVSFIAPICIDAYLKTDEISAYYFVGSNPPVKTSITLEYEIRELTQTGAKVRFINNLGSQIWIEKFKIYGKPLFKLEGNSVKYTERAEIDTTLEINNKYVQYEALARLNAQYAYLLHCKDKTKYTFSAFPVPFISLSNKVRLKTPGMDLAEDVVITNFAHSLEETQLTVISYTPYTFVNSTFVKVAANPTDNNVITLANAIGETTLIVSSDAPIAPTGLTATARVGGLEVNWNLLARQDIKGYWIEYKIAGTSNVTRKFRLSNSDWYMCLSSDSYEITLWAVNLKDVEGEKVTITTLAGGGAIKALQPIEETYTTGGKIPEAALNLVHDTATLYSMVQNLDPNNTVQNLTALTTKVNELLTDDGLSGRVVVAEAEISSLTTRMITAEGINGITGLRTDVNASASELSSQALAAYIPTEFKGVIVGFNLGVNATDKFITVTEDLRSIPTDDYTSYKIIVQKIADGKGLQTTDVTNIVINLDSNNKKTTGGKIYYSGVYATAPVANVWQYRIGRPKLTGSMIQQTANEIKHTVYGVDWDTKSCDDAEIADIDTADALWTDKPTNSLFSSIVQTNDIIRMVIGDNKNSFSALSLAIDGINATVANNMDSANTQIAAVNIKADNINLTVLANKGDADTKFSSIDQTISNISSTVSSKVGKTELISQINQTAETITIAASKIALGPGIIDDGTGKVKVNTGAGLTIDGNGVVKVSNLDASWITAGNISADRIQTGSIKADKLVIDSTFFNVDSNTGKLILQDLTANKITAGLLKAAGTNGANNYFNLDAGTFKVGNTSSYMQFDGTKTSLKGSLILDNTGNLIEFAESGFKISDKVQSGLSGYTAEVDNSYRNVYEMTIQGNAGANNTGTSFNKIFQALDKRTGCQSQLWMMLNNKRGIQGENGNGAAVDINCTTYPMVNGVTPYSLIEIMALRVGDMTYSGTIPSSYEGVLSYHKDTDNKNYLWLWRDNTWNKIK